MTTRDDLARRRMLGVLAGSWLAQGCYALARLGIADAIGDGVADVADVARATGVDPVALRRLLRALALAGLLKQPEPGRFALTSSSMLLRSDVNGSVHANALMQGDEVFRSFSEITHTLVTGEPAFQKVYGTPFYRYLEDHPRAAAAFYQSMGAESAPAGLAGCEFSDGDTVVDVGGGNGVVLEELLSAHPRITGVLVDLPEAVRAARARLEPFASRVSFVEADFFADELPAGADAYVLCRVLHNWRDENAAGLLSRVRRAMAPGARLIVAEEFLPEDGAGGAGAGLVDLLMLVTLEGRDRTADEYRALATSSGFRVTGVRRSGQGDVTGVLEAVAI
jgi:SAM-dependent methyltransferase